MDQSTQLLTESTESIAGATREPSSPNPAILEPSESNVTISSPSTIASPASGAPAVATESSESLEVRYTKIKQYALRLKKALAEKTEEIERLTNEKNSKKALSTLQLELDKALDENEKLKLAQKTMEKDLKASIDDNLRLKESSFQTQSQIQNLTASNIILKDKVDKLEKADVDISKLKARITELELELKNTHDFQIDMKQEKRQTAILALEITDYEKKLADLNEKYEEKVRESSVKSMIIEENHLKTAAFETKIRELESTIEDLTKIRENLNLELSKKSDKIQYLQDEFSKLNERFSAKKSELTKLQQEFETAKLNFSSESKTLVEKSESLLQLVGQLEHKISVLEENRRSRESQVSNLKLELGQMESEFTNYKLKAQAMLNSQKPFGSQNTSKEPDELENLQKIVHDFHSEISVLKSEMQTLKLENENLILERAELGLKLNKFKTSSMERELSLSNELQKIRQEVRAKETQIQKLGEEIALQREAISTSYKVQIEALKQENSEKVKKLEDKLNAALAANLENLEEISAPVPIPRNLLISHEGAALSQLEEQLRKNYLDNFVDIPAERGECEGSENAYDFHQQQQQPIKPKQSMQNLTFEELLLSESSDSIANGQQNELINSYKAELLRSQNQMKHLTSLLRESESNCERLTQLSEALKEEIRRVERDAGRKEHLKENTEYLKNVILKYTSLHGADEKLRLIPVLKTMLKLSPEEVEKLESSVRGAGSMASGVINTPSAIAAGLSSLIPRWSPG